MLWLILHDDCNRQKDYTNIQESKLGLEGFLIWFCYILIKLEEPNVKLLTILI